MRREEQLARETAAQLRAAGLEADARGEGVHWRVVATSGARSVEAACFWYEAAITGLMLGMNPSNARRSLGDAITTYDGPELATRLLDGGRTVDEGRTRTPEAFHACVRAWLAGATPQELIAVAPFIGELRRAAEVLAARLDPRVRRAIGGDPSFELWAYGPGERACRAARGGCAFFVGQAQLAHGVLADPAAAIDAWTVGGATLDDVAAHGATIERHAALLFDDPARWHWAHVRDRIANPNDVLAPLAPLLRALADSPIASRFFTFSSLSTLCFSASSHYPWVGALPTAVASRDGGLIVGETRAADVASAVRTIEAALAASPIAPFFGSAPHHELPAVAAAFAAAGSTRVPEIYQTEQWANVAVVDDDRIAMIHGRHLTCVADGARWDLRCRSLADVVGLALRFVDERASRDQLTADLRTVRTSR